MDTRQDLPRARLPVDNSPASEPAGPGGGGMAAATAAVLVIYGRHSPDVAALRRLGEGLGALVVVDNRETPDRDWSRQCAGAGIVMLANANRGALAGAYNMALGHLRRHHPRLRHVLFLDEDSDPSALRSLLADPRTAERAAAADTAAVAAAYRERATGLRARYLRMSRWKLQWLPREFAGIERVAFVINSMSLWSLAALDRIGPFDERLALDHVDTDACLRARRAGLSIYVHGGHEFLHSIGERRRFRIFGREMQAGGHSPARRRLIARNTVWLARREVFRLPAFALLSLSRLAYEAVGILMAEPDRGAKLKALAQGIAEGLFTRGRAWE